MGPVKIHQPQIRMTGTRGYERDLIRYGPLWSKTPLDGQQRHYKRACYCDKQQYPFNRPSHNRKPASLAAAG